MRPAFVAACLAATLGTLAPRLAVAASACAGEITEVSKLLKQENFPAPTKPGVIVTGSSGGSMPAGTLSQIKTLIAEADRACGSGDNDGSIRLAARARQLLEKPAH